MRTSLPYIIIYSILAFICTSCNYDPSYEEIKSKTAVLGAFGEETTLIKNLLRDKHQYQIEGVKFFTGRIENQYVVLAETGIGKVNASMTTTLLIEHFKPTEVIFTGIAGSTNPDILPGDIVIGEKTAQHDRGHITPDGFINRGTISPIDNIRNPVFIPADKRLLQATAAASETIKLQPIETLNEPRYPKIIKGIIVTGDCFVASNTFSNELRKRLGADAVEMEGAAVAQICYQQKVPCIVIRSISDKADEKAVSDLDKFYKTAAENSAKFVLEIIQQLSAEHSGLKKLTI